MKDLGQLGQRCVGAISELDTAAGEEYGLGDWGFAVGKDVGVLAEGSGPLEVSEDGSQKLSNIWNS